MQEKGIAILCGLIAIAGIAALLALSPSLTPVEVQISQIDQTYKGSLVFVHGIASGVQKTNGNYFFKICQSSSCIEVPIFQSLAYKIEARGLELDSIKSGDSVAVIGTVGEYKGQLQIVPSDETGFELTKAKN